MAIEEASGSIGVVGRGGDERRIVRIVQSAAGDLGDERMNTITETFVCSHYRTDTRSQLCHRYFCLEPRGVVVEISPHLSMRGGAGK